MAVVSAKRSVPPSSLPVPATGPLEQGQAQMVFQQLQLPADRAMGYMQGLCSAANAAQTCGGLECPQGIQRRQQ